MKQLQACLYLTLLLSTVVFSCIQVLPTGGVTYFLDGFESGDYTYWDNVNNATIDTSNPQNGTYYSLHEPDGSGKSSIYVDISALTTVYMGFYFRLDSDIGDWQQVGLCELRNDTVPIFVCALADRGAQYDIRGNYFYPGTTGYDSTDFSLTLSTWYFVQIYFEKDASTGAYGVWFNNVSVYSTSGLDTSDSPDFTRGLLGAYYYFIPTGNTTSYDTVMIGDTYLIEEGDKTPPDGIDDFNDNSHNTTFWDYEYGNTFITHAEEAYRFNWSIPTNDAAMIRQVGHHTNVSVLDTQIDVYIPPEHMGTVYFGLSYENYSEYVPSLGVSGVFGGSIWHSHNYHVLVSSNYGGIIEIYYQTILLGSATRAYSGAWSGRYSQLRLRSNGTHIHFYQDDVLIYTSINLSAIYRPLLNWNLVYFGAYNVGSQSDNRQGCFDNFFYFQDQPREAYTLTARKTYGMLYVNNMIPEHNFNFSLDRNFLYPKNLNVSHYAILDTGFTVQRWEYISPTISTNATINPFFVVVNQSYLLQPYIRLSSAYRLLTLEAYSLGVEPSIDYGVHAYPVDTELTLLRTLVPLNPPNIYPTFDGWYVNSVYTTDELRLDITLSDNMTVATNASFATPIDTWDYRTINTMVDIVPAYPCNESGYTTLLDRLVSNVSPQGQITHVAIRTFWAWNNTPTPPVPYLYVDETQHPSFTQLASAIAAIQVRGFDAMLVIAHLFGDSAPSGWDWENVTAVTQWLQDYDSAVVQPVATFAETNNVDILAIAAEITHPETPDDIPLFFTNNNISAEWITMIGHTRQNFSNTVIVHEASHWGSDGFTALEGADYMAGFDFVILATWRDGLALTEPYTAYDMAMGWFDAPSGGSMGRNTMQDMATLSSEWGVQISLNLGWHNAYGANLVTPWGGAGTGDFRYDAASTLAWQGAIWAMQPQTWCAGMDFERYNEYYALGFPDTYTSTSIALVNASETLIQTLMDYVITQQTPSGPGEYEGPYVPPMFIFGMTGLISMFAGLLYPIHLCRQKEYIQALRMFAIFFFLGVGLFLAWVWM